MEREKKKRRKQRKSRNILGMSLGILLVIITIAFFVLLKILNVVPDKYFTYGTIAVSFITIIITIFLFIRSKNTALKVIKIVCILLSIILIGGYSYGAHYLNKTMNFINNISLIREEVTDYYIVVLKEAKYQETSDLYEKSLAYYNMTDKKVLESIKLNLKYTSINDINKLKEKLFNQEVEAILISDIIKNKYEEEDEGFNDKIRILETISVKSEIEDITKKVSMKNTPFNVLISGIDTFGDINKTSRNDVNIIATVNPNTNEILLTAIPRDYYVQLHGTTGYKDKLTHASYYGINMHVQTVEDIFDIDINYYIKVNFSTVIDLVDELGGIDVYADQPMYFRNNCSIQKGYNHIDGACALSFSRERKRYVGGDRQRGKNQQEVIKAIFNKLTNTSTLLTEYNNILKILDGEFATNMDMDEVLNLIKYEMDSLKNYHIESIQVDGEGSSGETYSYPNEKLWIMIPDEETIKNAKTYINKVLNNESIRKQ